MDQTQTQGRQQTRTRPEFSEEAINKALEKRQGFSQAFELKRNSRGDAIQVNPVGLKGRQTSPTEVMKNLGRATKILEDEGFYVESQFSYKSDFNDPQGRPVYLPWACIWINKNPRANDRQAVAEAVETAKGLEQRVEGLESEIQTISSDVRGIFALVQELAGKKVTRTQDAPMIGDQDELVPNDEPGGTPSDDEDGF